MKQTNEEYSNKLWEHITYGINLSFNKLIDEKRKNGEKFVLMKDGKIALVDAHEVEYRDLTEPCESSPDVDTKKRGSIK